MVSFFEKMLVEFSRLLTAKGTAVILVGRESGFETALDNSHFKTETQISTLVSGQKASVYKITK